MCMSMLLSPQSLISEPTNLMPKRLTDGLFLKARQLDHKKEFLHFQQTTKNAMVGCIDRLWRGIMLFCPV